MTTQDHPLKPTDSAPDMAPASLGEQAGKANGTLDTVTSTAKKPENFTILEPKKRDKTWGENRFNIETYGGIALLGNEASSLLITQQAEHGLGQKLYTPAKAWFKTLETKKFMPKYVSSGDLLGVLVALVGGMLMVPFVKYREDHKGEIVREYDRNHYGARAESDQKLVEAHTEMDHAPKQSWGSLWKGRLLTVAGAISFDALAGRTDAPLTKLFNGNKYVSMDGIAEAVSAKSVEWLKISEKHKPQASKWLTKGTWLLTLSSALTIAFYVSSKIFAKNRDIRIERKHEQLHNPDAQRDNGEDTVSTPLPQVVSLPNQPQAKVSNVQHEETLAEAPQLIHA